MKVVSSTNPFYVRRTSANTILCYFINCLDFSDEEKFIRKVILLLYVGKVMSKNKLKYLKYPVKSTDILEIVYDYTDNKKIVSVGLLRELFNLKSKETFHKQFATYFKENSINPKGRRAYSLKETSKLIKYWFTCDEKEIIIIDQMDDVFTKQNIAKLISNGNYEHSRESFEKMIRKKSNNPEEDMKYFNENNIIRPSFFYKLFLTNAIEGVKVFKIDCWLILLYFTIIKDR